MNDQDHNARTPHRAEFTYDIAASPEQVWQAIATAGGISTWMVPTSLDPRVGGEVSFDFGEFSLTGTVTAYEPQTRFAYEEPWPIAERPEKISPEMADWFKSRDVPLEQVYDTLARATPIATEFLVEAQSGGSCVVRIITSAYGAGSDWENEFFEEMVETTRPIWDALAAHFASVEAR